MSFAWPLALVSAPRRAADRRRLLVAAPKTAPTGGHATRASRCSARCCRDASAGSATFPIALLLASLAALGLAAGRPHVERDVPYARTSIILALDVSGSMCSTDVKPNRLVVAQEAIARVRRGPAGRGADGSRRLLGVRGAGGAADDRALGAHGDDRHGHDRSRHRDRRGDAQGARRNRRGESGRPTGRRHLRARGRRRRPAVAQRAGRRARTTTCRTSSCSSPTAGTRAGSSRSTRCPTRSSGGCASTRSGSGRPSPRSSRARASSSAAGSSAAGFGGGPASEASEVPASRTRPP